MRRRLATPWTCCSNAQPAIQAKIVGRTAYLQPAHVMASVDIIDRCCGTAVADRSRPAWSRYRASLLGDSQSSALAPDASDDSLLARRADCSARSSSLQRKKLAHSFAEKQVVTRARDIEAGPVESPMQLISAPALVDGPPATPVR